jgi:ATP-dependent helicase/nuclease subunit B
MSDKFLSQVASYILSQMGDDAGNTVIVLPSQRASVYLRKHLAAQTDKVRFAPDMLTLDQFITRFSPLKTADRVELLFQLYECYLKVWQSQAEPLERFLKWAPMALKDFNDIDAYLIDPVQIFRDLTNLKELDEWSLNESDLTDNQQQYAWFWKKLGALYFDFREKLMTEGVAYQGLVFRAAAENVEQRFSEMDYKRVFFCGFNALSNAEERIMQHLQVIGKAEFLWDADKFYLDYPGHEAGLFLRKNLAKYNQSAHFISNDLLSGLKNISIYAVPNEVSQCDVMAHLIKSNPELHETAVVLANENLLPAVLNALPDSVQSANVTMGFNVRNSPLHSLFNLLFKLQGTRSQSGAFHHRQLSQLLNHSYLNFNRKVADAGNYLQRKIVGNNLIYLSPEILKSFDTEGILSGLIDAIDIKNDTALSQWQMQSKVLKFIIGNLRENDHYIEREYLFHYLKVMRKLGRIVEKRSDYFTASAYPRIFMALTMSENLSFMGEPLAGLQVMGMLETRTLDFKTIILLSCNEDVLPGNKLDLSLIPFELKKYYHLPTRAEHDAIYAYHFYRLLQRAENVHLLYNTSADDWQSSEPSRYLAQIENDFEHITTVHLQQFVSEIKLTEFKTTPVQIEKNQDVLDQIKTLVEKKLSPSALNAYVLCPLNFYYTYLIGFRQAEEVEETIEATTLGTVVHNVLEKMYTPFLTEGVLNVEKIEACRKNCRNMVEKEFREVYSSGGVESGNNRLILEVAVKFVDRFLSKEIIEVKAMASENQYVQILALEKKLERKLLVETPIGPVTVCLSGTADRIDKIGATTRIIDYKTGNLDAAKLKVKDAENLLNDAQYSKALQLLTYAWLYEPEMQANEWLEAGIISFRNMKEFVHAAQWKEQTQLNSENLLEFEQTLQKLISGMFDAKLIIRHNPASEWCNFCEQHKEDEENSV